MSRFLGEDIGRTDDLGRVLRCGDRVKLTVRRKDHTIKSTQDGWGRDIQLAHSDWQVIPKQEKTFYGTITYSDLRSMFLITWDEIREVYAEGDILPPSDMLFGLGKNINHPNDFLLQIDTE